MSTQAHHAALQGRETRRMLAFDSPVSTRWRITRQRWSPFATALASVVVVVALGKLVMNWLDVYLVFFGDQPEVDPSNITAYRVWGAIAVAALLCGVVAHALNRRRRVLGSFWQALLVACGTGIVVISYIPGAVHLPAPEHVEDGYSAPPCYSGGDNDECVGG
ncbi:DUF6234 family protein [Nocardioides sp. NPDC058538]|uniref:DUF6234 family protein n=1 Tax=Nocardioides sp. NPDC058538 TaxID=3346542 RepID=UPI00364C00BA